LGEEYDRKDSLGYNGQYGEDRMHSTDIAFKPSSNGWGYTPQYATRYDNIFQKKTSGATESGAVDKKGTTHSKRSKLFATPRRE
jgi:hypothetical protein